MGGVKGPALPLVVAFVHVASCGPIRAVDLEQAELPANYVSCNDSAAEARLIALRGFILEDIKGEAHVYGQNFRILQGSGPGRCSADFAAKWVSAMRCAQLRNTVCLGNLNAAMSAKVADAMAGRGMPPLKVYCPMTAEKCGLTVALTHRQLGEQMLNPDTLNQLISDDVCSSALHEAIHWMGDDGSAEHNTRKEKDDQVYACSRYCGFCQPSLFNNGMKDCLKCAGTPAERIQCGTRVRKDVGLGCTADTCFVSGGAGHVPGLSCRLYTMLDCEDKPLMPVGSCSEVCPANTLVNLSPCENMDILYGYQEGPCAPPPMCR